MIKTEWFNNPDWWFNCDSSVDQYIAEKYGYLLDAPESYDPIENILRYDQLPRHVFRNKNEIDFYLQKAISITNSLDLLALNDPHEFVFALLPWRHSKDTTLIFKAMEIAWKKLEETSSPIIKRFLKASYERCPMVDAIKEEVNANCTFDRSILDFDGKVTDFPKTQRRGSEKLILSISGGVDSMRCSHEMRDSLTAAIHINYGNRDTAEKETQFVAWWCNLIGVPLYVCRINEIKRKPCMDHGLRDTYERYTRERRYWCYRQFGPDAKIVLGHNKDDVLENIITNIISRQKFENLDGMEFESVVDGITFVRPMLDIPKDKIYEYAHAHGIPYLPNSTPTWSQRGKIRASLVGAMNDYSPNLIESLHYMSNMIRNMHALIPKSNSPLTTITIDKLSTDVSFWTLLFQNFNVSAKQKAIHNVVERIRQVKEKEKAYINLHIVLNPTTNVTIMSYESKYKVGIHKT